MALSLEKIQHNEIKEIQNSKGFQRLSEKSQVMVASVGQEDIVKNRGSHSNAVVTSAHAMMLSIAEQLGMESKYDVDYRKTITQSCLLHDIGHPPFGHDGADILNNYFKSLGLEEGFDDNNNNITVILANNIVVRDEVIADIIKYPNRMYKEHEERFLPILDSVIKRDCEYFSKYGINLKDQKRTIACQIMDEADRNTYTCDDMADFYCLNCGVKIKLSDILPFIDKFDEKQLALADKMVSAVNSGSKTEIRSFFDGVKDLFNDNYKLTDYGIKMKDKSIYGFREALSKMSFEFYIKPLRVDEFHLDNVKRLEVFINHCVDGYYNESKYYGKRIKDELKLGNKKRVLEYIRDMVAEVSDHFVINYTKKLLENDIDKIKSKRRLN